MTNNKERSSIRRKNISSSTLSPYSLSLCLPNPVTAIRQSREGRGQHRLEIYDDTIVIMTANIYYVLTIFSFNSLLNPSLYTWHCAFHVLLCVILIHSQWDSPSSPILHLGKFSEVKPQTRGWAISSLSDLGAHDLFYLLCLPLRRPISTIYINRHKYSKYGWCFPLC